MDRVEAAFTFLGGLILFILGIVVVTLFGKQFLLHFKTFARTLTESSTLSAVETSFLSAFLAVLVSLSLGVPLAYMLARRDFWGKGLIEGLVDLPMAIPHTAAGIALLITFGTGGLIGGATEPFFTFERSRLGIVTAMTFISAPYLINSAREGFQRINPRLENVARTLGASRWEVFRRIDFPLAIPHIYNGAVMSWARSISEFSAVVLFVGIYPTIAPTLIWNRLQSQGLVEAMSIATVLLAFLLPTFVVLRYLGGKLFDKY